jgi:hypothetical protein
MSHSGSGVSWGDFDSDGDQDLYVTRYGQPNNPFRNDGPNAFVDVAVGSVLANTGHGRAAPCADYDNDGDLDLFLANEGDPNKLFRNDGDNGFTDATMGSLGDDRNDVGVCWGDYDLDGNVDLYITEYLDGASRLFRNEGGGGFSDVTSQVLIKGRALSDAASWGDYDNDGDLDIYISSRDGNLLLRNHGSGPFVDVTAGPLGITGPSEGVAWGDYANDGDLDLYIAREFSFGRLLRNDSNGQFSDATNGPLGGPAGYTVAWGDFDNDADLDLYVTPSRLMRNDGVTQRARTSCPETRWLSDSKRRK